MNIASLAALLPTYTASSVSATKATSSTSSDSPSAAQTTAPGWSSSGGTASVPPLELPTRESFAAATATFTASSREAFREAGIRVPPEAVLTPDSEGYVSVANNHPDKAKIEQLFHTNKNLRDQFAKVSSDASLLRSAQTYGDYANRYAQLVNNPQAQAALVEARVAQERQNPYITLGSGQSEIFFGGLQGVSA